MCDMPLVSVVVPTFNDSKFIKETLVSILNQTYTNLDIVVVDDCSSDNTVEVIKTFSDKRIRLFQNNKNKGAAFSRNRAISECLGDYIAFLDGDDLWSLNKIETQVAFMLKNHISFSSTFYSFVDEEGNSLSTYMSSPKKITHKSFLRTDHVGCLTVMYERKVFPNLKIPDDIKKRNDYALWIRLSERCDCYSIPTILAHHRRRFGSISSVSKWKLISYHKELFQKLYGFNKIKSSFYAWRNGFYFLIRKCFYIKKVKNNAKI